MLIDRQTHWQFLNDELRAETEEFKKKFEAKASFLLKDSEEMFVGQFVSFKNGEMIVLFPTTRAIPRKGDFLYCMLLPKDLRDFHNWGERTYENLYQCRYKGSECVVIWHAASDDPRLIMVGIRRVDVEFQSFIENTSGILLTFAPQMPPTEYIANLQKVVKQYKDDSISKVLDIDYVPSNWKPSLIKENETENFVLRQLELTDTMILQGPPGTGKTTLIARICAKLIKDGKSLLVTALTNRALMEIAGKEDLRCALKQSKLCKTNMTSDESQELRELVPLKSISIIQGSVVLSTFFSSSGFAAEMCGEMQFDYVIMDEASQAITAMFAASRKIGQKCLWVGDTHQLPPIIALNDDMVNGKNYYPLVNGLEAMANSSGFPVCQLTYTYRFGQRSSSYTGVFYDDTLKAYKDSFPSLIFALQNVLHPKGGPTLVMTDMPFGDTAPAYAVQIVSYIIGKILQEKKSKEIAVLTCLIRTTKALQKSIAQSVGTSTNLIVDTIARIQGLTTDIVILLIPNVSYLRTLEPHLFNVATSRAREHTIIVADKNILLYKDMDINVRRYLQMLQGEKMIYIPLANNVSKVLQ